MNRNGLLCHLAGTYKQEQQEVPDGSGNTIVVEYVMCARCHKTLEKNDYIKP